jgi:hypothetical protein
MNLFTAFDGLELKTFFSDLVDAQRLFPWRPSLMRDRLDDASVSLLALSAKNLSGTSSKDPFLHDLAAIARVMNEAAYEIEKRQNPPVPELSKKLRQHAILINTLLRTYAS